MTEAELKQDVKTIYTRLNTLSESMAVVSAIMPRIEESLKCLPCRQHEKDIETNKQDLYAAKKVWGALFGGATLISVLIGLFTFIGRIAGWF